MPQDGGRANDPAVAGGEHPRRGDFDWGTLVGTHQPDPGDAIDDRGYFGLVLDASFPFGTFRSDDGELFTAVRKIGTAGVGGRVKLQTTLDGGGLRMHPGSKTSASGKIVTRSRDGDSARIASPADDPGKPFEFVFRTGGCHWEEDGLLAIDTEMVGPGVHWYTPFRDGGAYYVSHLYEAEGTVLDRPVRGFVGFDQFYFPEGMTWGTDPFVRGVELAWFTWGNRYADGSVEMGHTAFGHGRWGFALHNRPDGNVVCTSDVDGAVHLGPDGHFPERIDFTVEGEEWEWVVDERGTMPDFGPIEDPQSEGRMRRVGDDRVPEVWFAWGETAPSHGNRRSDAGVG